MWGGGCGADGGGCGADANTARRRQMLQRLWFTPQKTLVRVYGFGFRVQGSGLGLRVQVRGMPDATRMRGGGSGRALLHGRATLVVWQSHAGPVTEPRWSYDRVRSYDRATLVVAWMDARCVPQAQQQPPPSKRLSPPPKSTPQTGNAKIVAWGGVGCAQGGDVQERGAGQARE